MLFSSSADFSYGPVLAIVSYKVPAADPRWGWSTEPGQGLGFGV